jgi:4-diphosphocytidyl-2-C-methyl-D-erythritol kinase
VGRAVKVLRLPSFAKVNLGLEVLGTRADGYHELRTLFQTITLHDDVELRPHATAIEIRCDHPGVPTDRTNLAHRAASELRRFAGIAKGVTITITKRIPVAGGLGGGSSNAAVVLMGLDRLWRLGLGAARLHPLARRLGADVPFFLMGGTALGLGRGDEVYPLLRQVRAHVVVVDPGRPLSTAAVFRRLDQGLTPRENANSIFRFVSSQLDGQGDAFPGLSNDLERAALEEDPGLAAEGRDIRGILVREGASLASLSGSGAVFFGVFSDPGAAQQARSALLARGFRAIRGRTLSLDGYRRMVSQQLPAPPSRRGASLGRSGHHGDHGRQGHSRRR